MTSDPWCKRATSEGSFKRAWKVRFARTGSRCALAVAWFRRALALVHPYHGSDPRQLAQRAPAGPRGVMPVQYKRAIWPTKGPKVPLINPNLRVGRAEPPHSHRR